MLKKYYTIVKNNPLFANIEDNSIDQLLSCLNPAVRHYKKNQFIALAGDPFTSIGVVLEGRVSIIKESASGNKMVIAQLHPGEMFGEMIAFSNQDHYPVSVEAVKDATVMELDRSAIIGQCPNMCSWHKTLIQNMLKIVSNRALMLNKKVEYLSIKSMRGKLCTFFVDELKRASKGSFTLKMNRNQLAEYLNVSRPSMSREMAKLRDEGIIDFRKNHIRVLDENALMAMAE